MTNIFGMIGPAAEGLGLWCGVAIAVIASFLRVWTTIVATTAIGMGFFMVVMAVAVGSFSARVRAGGMTATMIGVATMQAASAR